MGQPLLFTAGAGGRGSGRGRGHGDLGDDAEIVCHDAVLSIVVVTEPYACAVLGQVTDLRRDVAPCHCLNPR